MSKAAGGGGISQGAELYLAPGLNGTPAQTFLYGANGDTGGGELDLIGGGGSNANTNGGPVLIQGGSNNYTGAAGSAQLLGGNANVNGTPGNVVVQGGAIAYSRSSVNAGSVTLAGGITNGTGAGGDIILSIGTGPGAGGAPLGKLKIANATTHTSSPSAGGAGTLPATPAGYISVYINGVARQIAYY